MKKEDLVILILGLLLLAGMLLTIFFGGEKSIHGVGGLHDYLPGNFVNLVKKGSARDFWAAVQEATVMLS